MLSFSSCRARARARRAWRGKRRVASMMNTMSVISTISAKKKRKKIYAPFTGIILSNEKKEKKNNKAVVRAKSFKHRFGPDGWWWIS